MPKFLDSLWRTFRKADKRLQNL